MTDTPLAPSDAERAEWPDNTRNYVEFLETGVGFVPDDPGPTDLTNPGNIPFGQLPRATQEAMVIAHVLDGWIVGLLDDGVWIVVDDPSWADEQVYAVGTP